MKILLSMMAATGIAATAGAGVISCGHTVSAKEVNVDVCESSAAFTRKMNLSKGTILIVDADDSNLLEVIPYKLTNDSQVTPFLGIVMKPQKEVKVDQVVHLTELNATIFTVSKDSITDYVKQQIGTDNDAYILTKDASVEVTVDMDIEKQLSEDESKISWTLVELSQVEDGYKVSSIRDKINITIPADKGTEEIDKTVEFLPLK